MCAGTKNIPDGTSAVIKIIEKAAGGNDADVATLTAPVRNNTIECAWKIVYAAGEDDTNSEEDENVYALPEYAFIIECGGIRSKESGLLAVRGGLQVIVKDAQSNAPLKNTKVSILQNGFMYKTVETDDKGYFELFDIPIGKFEVKPESSDYYGDFLTDQYMNEVDTDSEEYQEILTYLARHKKQTKELLKPIDVEITYHNTSESQKDAYFKIYTHILKQKNKGYEKERTELHAMYQTINTFFALTAGGGTYFGHQAERICAYVEYDLTYLKKSETAVKERTLSEAEKSDFEYFLWTVGTQNIDMQQYMVNEGNLGYAKIMHAAINAMTNLESYLRNTFYYERAYNYINLTMLKKIGGRSGDEEATAVFYTEEDNRSEGNYTDWSSSAGLQAAIKTARAKNWTIYKQIVGGDFEELEVTEESERGTGFGGAAVPIDKTYTVKGVSFTMKGITAVTDAVLGDNSMEDNQEHSVNLSAYYIGETEVTQELWLAVMGNNPSYFDGSQNSEPAKGEAQGKRPVENVTWFDCIVFCNELTKKVSELEENQCVYTFGGHAYTKEDAQNQEVPEMDMSKKGFRLPTETEWEWAAKGGKEYRWAGTDEQDELKKYAWYAWYDDSDGGDANNKTHEVKQKQANGYGLYDMSGNVWEWCWDWYDDNTPAEGHDLDGVGAGSVRVIRGGSWFNRAIYAACASRDISNPVSRCDFLGLRVAYSVGK
ncbi:SUMF1/EgtB/PvdO family nonheme iron enzyme [Treponema denticola]|uniref:SUMF1/EgtB/PvdO family nonheme iron enzyme n=3 Tax=Treponema TaxID=157 RepID=UPI0021076959|nr:SUMF1/EgtB/PvdO family nonheme iron enzyme [Treponema denticola]